MRHVHAFLVAVLALTATPAFADATPPPPNVEASMHAALRGEVAPRFDVELGAPSAPIFLAQLDPVPDAAAPVAATTVPAADPVPASPKAAPVDLAELAKDGAPKVQAAYDAAHAHDWQMLVASILGLVGLVMVRLSGATSFLRSFWGKVLVVSIVAMCGSLVPVLQAHAFTPMSIMTALVAAIAASLGVARTMTPDDGKIQQPQRV
jgi:hypothetical protein